MNKVILIGSPGSGKSTLSKKLAEATGLPLFHLDALYWKPNWVETPKEEWDALLHALVSEPQWIIDGNYGRTLDIRLQTADTIIWLQKPNWLCAWRAVKRQISHFGKVRSDMGEGCVERFRWEFLRFLVFIWRFPKQSGRRLGERISKLMALSPEKKVIILRSDSEAESFLNTWNENDRVFSG
ncbi:AAA family ATPase [Paenibacillus allorhizosphaerae]|uniref:ATPase AAA-type core domain-containing protein n=1 Tax=Paenibacillus allorhizosphaerae TaxID=2849866 RepID=A0ABN7TN75_9BACL|nr:AAA family ATPase [Paenibacillus allorhizosphaerae]CAG7648364.1 hypothetical protein PAECIP111802_04191 [Paenibacillus allorhizosphaerae]